MSNQLTVKEKLLKVLKKNGEQTIKQLTEHFSISEIALRRHVQELVREEFVVRQKNHKEIGRPFYTYMLTDKGHDTFPTHERAMSLELLEDLEELYGEEAVTAVLNKWLEREKSLLESEADTDNFDEKVKRIAQVREELGYMVEVSKTEEGDYTLKHYNCPVFTVACAYNQLCKKEMKVLGSIFSESEVETTSMITKGDNYCKLKIRRPKYQS